MNKQIFSSRIGLFLCLMLACYAKPGKSFQFIGIERYNPANEIQMENRAFEFPEPVSWEELQEIQSDSLLSPEVLGLSYECPDHFYVKPNAHVYRNILFTRYHWEEYVIDSGKCIVLIDKVDNKYFRNVLFVHEAQALLSASEGVGFDEKGYIKYYPDLLEMGIPEYAMQIYQNLTLGNGFVDKYFGIVPYDKAAGKPCNMNGSIIVPPSAKKRSQDEPLFSNYSEFASMHISDVIDCKVGEPTFRQD